VRKLLIPLLALSCALTLLSAAPAHAGVPDWVKPALEFLIKRDAINRTDFRVNGTMKRREFKRMMQKTFGGGYSKTGGRVRAYEVDKALVKVLGRGSLAKRLNRMKSPDGWDPNVPGYFGSEILAREMGLRRDRSTTEEWAEASASDRMRQADIVYAVYRAKTSPNTWAAEELEGFRLRNYGHKLRNVVRFAFQQVGKPYYWSGEWPKTTPAGYPYGAQSHGGFDCSGFVWYVLRQKESIWSPVRKYRGWRLDQRSSADMGANTPKRIAYGRLKPGDIMLFSSSGKGAPASSIYHAGIYLGRGWMIDSAGGQAGVSLSRVGGDSWWRGQFAWGRRVIK
jgi:cell wall-associated NlpC family hydrolase